MLDSGKGLLDRGDSCLSIGVLGNAVFLRIRDTHGESMH